MNYNDLNPLKTTNKLILNEENLTQNLNQLQQHLFNQNESNLVSDKSDEAPNSPTHYYDAMEPDSLPTETEPIDPLPTSQDDRATLINVLRRQIDLLREDLIVQESNWRDQLGIALKDMVRFRAEAKFAERNRSELIKEFRLLEESNQELKDKLNSVTKRSLDGIQRDGELLKNQLENSNELAETQKSALDALLLDNEEKSKALEDQLKEIIAVKKEYDELLQKHVDLKSEYNSINSKKRKYEEDVRGVERSDKIMAQFKELVQDNIQLKEKLFKTENQIKKLISSTINTDDFNNIQLELKNYQKENTLLKNQINELEEQNRQLNIKDEFELNSIRLTKELEDEKSSHKLTKEKMSQKELQLSQTIETLQSKLSESEIKQNQLQSQIQSLQINATNLNSDISLSKEFSNRLKKSIDDELSVAKLQFGGKGSRFTIQALEKLLGMFEEDKTIIKEETKPEPKA